jgi:hypothetical protein
MKQQMVCFFVCLSCIAVGRAAGDAPYYFTYEFNRATGHILFGGTSLGTAKNTVFAQSVTGGERRSLFQSRDGEVFTFSVAPESGHVAILEQVLKHGVSPARANFSDGGRRGFERSVLHVIAPNGTPLGTVQAVRAFSWRPSGGQLAVVTGEYRGHDIEPKLTGVWIYNVEARKVRRIATNGRYVEWAKFDDNLYVWDPAAAVGRQVSRYNVAIGRVEPTGYHSNRFSPTGEYYFKPDGIAGRPEIYSRPGNHGITRQSRVFSDVVAFESESWAPDADVLMLTIRKADRSVARMLYTPASDTGVEILRRGIVGWGRSSQELLVASGDTVSLRRLTELQAQVK